MRKILVLFKKIWHDPIGSVIIASIITGTPIIYFWEYVKSVYFAIAEFFSRSTEVPNWLLILLSLCAFWYRFTSLHCNICVFQ